jgi:hypothetical protein
MDSFGFEADPAPGSRATLRAQSEPDGNELGLEPELDRSRRNTLGSETTPNYSKLFRSLCPYITRVFLSVK